MTCYTPLQLNVIFDKWYKHPFADVRKQIQFGKGATQMVENYRLSRFAC